MTLLVTGATGNIGRMVVDRLLDAGVTDVRALTNRPERAALPSTVDVRTGYLGRVESLAGVFDGVETMYLAPLPQTVTEVTLLAAAAGVRRIVDLAGPKDGWWGAVEVAVEASGVAWTHLEPGEFMPNLLMWADPIRRTGTVREAFPEAANAPIALEDVADVATEALLHDEHVGKAYPMTGPESLTRAEMVGVIASVLGRDIPVERVSREDAIAELAPTMGEYAQWYVDGQADYLDHPQPALPTVAKILGRPGTTFREWVTRNRHEFS